MTRRHFVGRWIGVLGVTVALVGLIGPGMASAQTLAETRQKADPADPAPRYTRG